MILNCYEQHSITIRNYHILAYFFRHPLPCEYYVATLILTAITNDKNQACLYGFHVRMTPNTAWRLCMQCTFVFFC